MISKKFGFIQGRITMPLLKKKNNLIFIKKIAKNAGYKI